jgi:hypothetical protein
MALRCVALAGIAGGACAHGHDEDLARIESMMRAEDFDPEDPSVQGIALGPDAPALAPPFPEPPPQYRRRGGFNQVRRALGPTLASEDP